jgi:hypothetical protein
MSWSNSGTGDGPMHPYASEAGNRTVLYLLMAAVALVLTWFFGQSMQRLPIELPAWVEAPSVLVFFGLCWKFFDQFVWSWKVARWTGWTDVPDLRGVWTATIQTSFEGSPVSAIGSARIKQTASRMSIVIRWEKSHSYSVAGVLQIGGGAEPELIYQYINQPNLDAPATMQIHRGTAWLELISPTELVGEYYSGRGRQQMGKLSLVRETQESTPVDSSQKS